MGLRDLFGKEGLCPSCRCEGARTTFGKVKCRNPNCVHFDLEFSQKEGQSRSESPGSAVAAASTGPVRINTRHLSGHFDPGEHAIEIQYRNARGENRLYTGDVTTLRESGEHISLCLAPTGRRVAFAKKNMQNLDEVKGHPESPLGGPIPTPRESKVLRYHLGRGSTSKHFEELRQKYPNYR